MMHGLLFLCLLPGTTLDIPPALRILNRNSNCVFASCEMQGVAVGEMRMKNFAANHYGGCTPKRLHKWLKRLGVRYAERGAKEESKDWAFLDKYVNERGYGVCVAGKDHMMLLVGYDPEAGVVRVQDNGHTPLGPQTWTMSRFKKWWHGWSIVILPTK